MLYAGIGTGWPANLGGLCIVAVSSPYLFKGFIELGQAALRAPAPRVP